MFSASTTGRGNGVVWPTHSGIQIYYVTVKRHKNAYSLKASPKNISMEVVMAFSLPNFIYISALLLLPDADLIFFFIKHAANANL